MIIFSIIILPCLLVVLCKAHSEAIFQRSYLKKKLFQIISAIFNVCFSELAPVQTSVSVLE